MHLRTYGNSVTTPTLEVEFRTKLHITSGNLPSGYTCQVSKFPGHVLREEFGGGIPFRTRCDTGKVAFLLQKTLRYKWRSVHCRLGDEIYWLTLEYVTRNMEKVLILSEKNTKMSPPQWIACQLHMSRINVALPDWLFENSRPIRESGSLVLMTTILLRRSWNKTS